MFSAMKKTLIQTLTLTTVLLGSIVIASAHCGSCGVDKKKGKDAIADVTMADLKKAIADKKVVVIDVNGSKSYKKGHIPTALDFQALGKDGLAKALPSDKGTMVVAYCGGPSCKAYMKGAKAAKELGYTDVHHFSGGISGWKKAGGDLEKSE